jgi:RNA polymerase sigma-70 factor (ECF subfamily)
MHRRAHKLLRNPCCAVVFSSVRRDGTGGAFVSQAPSDAELVLRARDDPEVFGQLYELYVNQIYSYVYYRTGNHHDAEDLTAKTFYQALRHIAHYQDRGLPFSAWLYRIAHNLVANWHRDHSRRQVIALDEIALVSQRPSPETRAESQDDQRLLMHLIRHLSEERQNLLILKFVQQLSNREIADIMGRTEGAIKSLYHSTLLALREEWVLVKEQESH